MENDLNNIIDTNYIIGEYNEPISISENYVIPVKCKYDSMLNINGARCVAVQDFDCRKLRPYIMSSECGNIFFVDWIKFILYRKHLIEVISNYEK